MRQGKHPPGYASPKAMSAAVRAQLVPAALALSWVSRKCKPTRRGGCQYSQFEFERLGPNRIEHIGFDFRYGSKPDVWVSVAVWTGEGGVCTSFKAGDCWDFARYRKPWLLLWGLLWPVPRRRRMAEALAKGLRRLQIAERYLRDGVDHPDLMFIPRVPPHRWPGGYEDRIRERLDKPGVVTELSGKPGEG